MIYNEKYIIPFILLFGLFSSCSTSKYVGPGEYLLKENKIDIIDKQNVESAGNLKQELSTFFRQEPNSKLFWVVPREWFYFKNSGPGDSSWINKWGRNTMGETPVFYNESVTEETAQSMEQFLRNNKGYYSASVDYNNKPSKHKTKVTYNVNTGRQYKIGEIQYISKDTAILEVLNSISSESLISTGLPMDATMFLEEKTRMITELQNRGYANFSPNYIDIKGDSANMNNTVDVFFEIYPPAPDTIHKQYRVGDLRVFTDYYNDQPVSRTTDDTLHGIIFKRESKDYIVNPNTISSKIFLEKGDLLSRDRRLKTFKKLSELGSYRFVSMTPIPDPVNDTIIHYDILLTPQAHKWVTDLGTDVNYSSVNTPTGRQLFGFSASGLLLNRNFLKGSEQLTFAIDNGYEFNLDTVRLRTFTFGVTTNLELPKYKTIFDMPSLFNKLGLMSDSRLNSVVDETTTNITLGYNIITIRDFYKINSAKASLSYNYHPNPRTRFIVRQASFALNSFRLEDMFINIVNENPLIINSFSDNLITGYLFNEISFIHNSVPRKNGWSNTILGSFEISGLETFLANQAYNAISGSRKEWNFFNEISFAKYVRTEIDTRFYKTLTGSSSLAFRINGGIAIPYGGSEAIPFISQFSVGGPNSLRAWDQRELGPGGNREFLLNPPSNQAYFQQGDIKIEVNAEFRFDLFFLLEGAFFIDVGNVWTLKEDINRAGSQFTSGFYNQLAVGAGYGLRWDFTYFNIRFDFGYRVRDPFPSADTGSHWYSWQRIKSQGFGNLQVAVNYPF